jgi:hypothetical protein
VLEGVVRSKTPENAHNEDVVVQMLREEASLADQLRFLEAAR